MSEDVRERCTCGETACESELCDCDATPCPVNHRAEEAEAENARLQGELIAARNRVAGLEKNGAELLAHRDALIDEVKTLQQDLEDFGEAQKAWLRFRRERDVLKAAVERVKELRDQWVLTSMPANAPLGWPSPAAAYADVVAWLDAALDTPSAPESPEPKPDWRERARARVGDQVAARIAELEAEPPLSAEEFDEAMRRNKAEAEAYLHQQSLRREDS